MTNKDIMIVGGGIAGLTAALCLKKEGFNVNVFEKSNPLKEAGASISIFPNALRVMKHLDLYDEIVSCAGEMIEGRFMTDKGKILVTQKFQSDLPILCIHRQDLHDILRNAFPKENLHLGFETTSFLQDDQKVTVNFSNGKIVQGDLLIGAEGLYSNVREQIIGDGFPIHRGYTCWRGYLEHDKDYPGAEIRGKGLRFGITPIGKGRIGWYATANEPFRTSDEPEGSKQKLLRLFENWPHPVEELIEHSEEIVKNDVSDRKSIKGWFQGRAIVIGDAAHPTTPNMGQGGCMSIEDGPILARCLAKYDDHELAFEAFEDVRFPRVSWIVKNSRIFGRMGQWSNPIATTLRDFQMKVMPNKIANNFMLRAWQYDPLSVAV